MLRRGVAWPDRKLAIEVHGSIRESPFGPQIAERDTRKAAIYAAQGWRVLVVTERELRAEPRAARERARAFLAEPGGIGREEGGRGRAR